MDNCIFCKIAAGTIPAKVLYEDDDVIAFHDISPQAPVHFLLVPKKHVESMAQLADVDDAVMGKIMRLAGVLAAKAGSPDGFRTIVNTGRVGRQEVMHLHVHVLGGDQPLGPMLVRA